MKMNKKNEYKNRSSQKSIKLLEYNLIYIKIRSINYFLFFMSKEIKSTVKKTNLEINYEDFINPENTETIVILHGW